MCACVGLLAEQSQYNPVCTYLDSLKGKWDGQDHIAELFAAFRLDPEQEQDPQFLQLLLRRWLIGCVVMAYNDGREAAQGLLIIKGPQGRSKSRFLSKIVPDYRWVQDGSILDPADKDSKLDNLRYWIAELGEFGATLRRDKLEILKAFITRRTDTIRRPYARASRQEPRRTTFFGTINDDTFLKDITGDRRYWVIAVTHVDLDVVKALDIDQLWAQIVHYACEVEHTDENEEIFRHWLTTEEIDLLEAHNRQYKKVSVEEQALRDMLDWDAPVEAWQEYTVTELCDKFCLTKKSMTMLGLTIKAIAKNDKRIGLPKNHRNRVYKLPPMSKI